MEHLHDVALASGWGEPVYTALQEPEVGGQSPGSEPKYCYKVTLPSLPLASPHNTFQPQLWRPSADEAKADAAGMVLSLLRMSPDYLTSPILRPGGHIEASVPGHLAPASGPPLYSHALGPAHLQVILSSYLSILS